MTLPLRASELAASGHQLRHWFEVLDESGEHQRHRWAGGFAASSGIAATAAQEALERQLHQWRSATAFYARAGETLNRTAEAQERLEWWEQRLRQLASGIGAVLQGTSVIPLANAAADASFALGKAWQLLHHFGSSLDLACASELTALAQELQLCEEPTAPAATYPSAAEITQQFPGARVLAHHGDRAIVAFGPLEEATSITTLVAGVGSSAPAAWGRTLERTQHLANNSGGAAIAWIGYQAPASIAAGIAPGIAQRAGADLRTFQAGLRRSYPNARLVVLGHSYGSVVAGAAATTAQGLDADSLVLAGSPGIPGKPTLRSSSPRIVGVLSEDDPIGLTTTSWASLHGVDPVEAAFTTETLRIPSGGHSGYFTSKELLALLQREAQQPTPHHAPGTQGSPEVGASEAASDYTSPPLQR